MLPDADIYDRPMRMDTAFRWFFAALALGAGGMAAAQPDSGAPKHVVIVVWDGMRPDFARSDVAPNLAALAERGVRFMNHHSVYVTSTEVNGTALATGTVPAVNGIVTNVMYFPEVFAGRPVDTQDPVVIEKHDQLTGGRHVRLKTLPELVRDAGYSTAVATTKPVGFIWDRTQDEQSRKGCVTLAEGRTIPPKAIESIVATLGGDMKHFNDHAPGRLSDDTWTTRALLESLWKTEVPTLSVLWMAEPDASQHQFGPGSPEGLAAIRNSDTCLGMVEAALTQRGLLDQTDIIVVSDHGFSTIAQNFSPFKVAKAAGFDAVEQLPEGKTLAKGQIMVCANGGAVSYYVGGHDEATITKFTQYLQGTKYAGAIFTSTGEPGTFKLEDAFLNAPEAPDILVSMTWSEERSETGTPGMVVSEGGRVRGQGMHASLSPFDTHNTLIAAGPHFKKGWQNPLPTANSDVNPTVCEILGISPDPRHTGRVMTEAFEGGQTPSGEPKTTTLTSQHGDWSQYLTRTEFAGRVYLDQGGRGTTPKDVSKLVAEPQTTPAAK